MESVKKGRVYAKQTESWCGNDAKGTLVKVVKILDMDFIKYRKIKKIFGLNICIGPSYILNEISFKRIFMGIEFI